MFKVFRKTIALLAVAFLCFMSVAFAASSTDEAVLGADRWSVQNDGDLVPNANTYSIGSATQYPAAIWVAGAEYTSFAAGTDGNWTDTGLTTTLDQAPTKFIATHASGNFQATQIGVGTSGILGATNAQTITLETNNAIIFGDNSDTATMTFTANDISLNTSDGGYIFALTDATDGTVDIRANNDSDDYISFTTAANVPTIVTAGTSNLAIVPDGGTTAVTGILTVSGATTSTGILTATAGVTLENAETITNATDSTITLGGADDPIVSILSNGQSNSDATLELVSDNSQDNGDDWQIQADGATQDLLIRNNTSGSQATLLTIADTTGLITTTGDVIVAGTTPLVTIGDGGDEDAGIQINSDTNDFYIASENSADDLVIGLGSAIGTTPIISMTDTGVTTITGSTDGELNIWAAGATASDAYLRLIGDIQTDASDSWQLWNDSSAGSLFFGNDSTTPGTYLTKLTLTSAGALTATGITTVSDTTDASSLTAGSIITAGGVACAKQLYVGDDIDMSVSGTGVYDLTLKTNMADALSITDGTDIMVFATTTGTPTVTITPATTITGATTLTAALTANGDVIGDGGDQLYGFRREQVASTTAAIAVTDSGKSFVSNSADVITLPEASTVLGMRVTFISGTADDFDINPADGTDVIGPITASGGTITPSAGDAIRITDIGSSFTIEAVGANLWACVAHNGAITDVN